MRIGVIMTFELSAILYESKDWESNAYHCKVPKPVGAYSNSSSLSSGMQWKNLRYINPRNTVHTRSKNKHISEEEGD